MSRISVDVSSARIPVLQVGYQGENEVTDVIFDISSWITEFGEGVAQLRVKRPGNSEEESYVLSLTITDGIAVWTVSETDTFNKGNGKVQLSYLVGNIVKKAVIYPYKVGKSIVGADNPVDPFDSWIERSKAWAIGETLDGVDVPETDETYQNNAKYYAEQADILGSAQVVLATEKADAAAESEANAAASEAAVNGVSTQLTTRMSAIETEQSVQSARMDTFTSLPEGSTSGNAELADIRVGADGTTYDSAGNAVRGQIGELKSDLTDLYDNSIEVGELVDGYIDYESATVMSGSSKCTDYIAVKPNSKIRIRGAYLVGTRAIWAYDINKNKTVKLSPYNSELTELVVDIPNNSYFIRITTALTGNVSVKYVENLKEKIIDIEAELFASKPEKSKVWNKYNLPSFGMNYPYNVFECGTKFDTDFNIDDFKHTGGTTYYVSNSKYTTRDGLTRETATSFGHATSIANDGDTIIILEGKYDRSDFGSITSSIEKSLNIIGEGNVTIYGGNKKGEYLTVQKLDGYNNVYTSTRSYAKHVLDTRHDYIKYANVDSISVCDNTKGSYYINGSNVYFHLLDGSTTDDVLVTVNYEKYFTISNTGKDVLLYMENINLVGVYNGMYINRSDTTHSLTVCLNNVNTYACGNTDSDYGNGITVNDATTYFYNCDSSYGYKDGFNYIGSSCFATEISCIGSHNGHGASSNSMNGSTAHNGAKVLRINGKYFDNQGGNVADVQEGTKSINLGCKVFSPYCTDGYSQNFSAQQSGTEMWIDGCIAEGANTDMWCAVGSTLHIDNTSYKTDNSSSGGIFDIGRIRTVAEMMLLN